MIDPSILKKVRQIELRTARLVDDIVVGAYHAAFKGRGMEFEDVREYQPGDAIRTIDWNVTARTGRTHVKTFREERALTVVLLVDMSGSERFGTAGRTKADLVAEIAALLALAAIRNDDKIGLIVFTSEVELYIPPKKGKKHVLRLVTELLAFRPRAAGTRIDVALRFLGRVFRRRAVVFLLGDFQATGYERALAASKRKHDLIACRVEDPREEALPAGGLLCLEDPETGLTRVVDAASPAVREHVADRAAARRRDTERLIRKLGIDLLPLRTDRPYLPALRGFLRDRARRLVR
ncbi:MAG: DUF58 domain-containing protein [Planctomycetota bacterium]|jgi:uncharacterized protein (DUF58 family)